MELNTSHQTTPVTELIRPNLMALDDSPGYKDIFSMQKSIYATCSELFVGPAFQAEIFCHKVKGPLSPIYRSFVLQKKNGIV